MVYTCGSISLTHTLARTLRGYVFENTYGYYTQAAKYSPQGVEIQNTHETFVAFIAPTNNQTTTLFAICDDIFYSN